MSGSVREEASLEYHERRAAHYRALAATAVTPALKSRLLRQAEMHERLASGEAEPAALAQDT